MCYNETDKGRLFRLCAVFNREREISDDDLIWVMQYARSLQEDLADIQRQTEMAKHILGGISCQKSMSMPCRM